MANFRQEVSDDVQRLGKSFGSFIEDVGKAVAETQKKLDVNSAEITKDLAATEIEVPSVIEQVLDDDGTPSSAGNAVNVVRQKMSLIQFIVPTFYQWRHVQLNLRFDVEEIGSIKDFKIRTKSKTHSFLGIPIAGGTTKTTEGTLAAEDTDKADGSVDARLEPRPDITPPSPFLFRTGPTINFIPGTNIPHATDPAKTIGADLTIKVYKADGTLNTSQPIKVSVNQGRYEAPGGLTTDGTTAEVLIKVYKPNPDATESQVVTVNVVLGIISTRIDVTI